MLSCSLTHLIFRPLITTEMTAVVIMQSSNKQIVGMTMDNTKYSPPATNQPKVILLLFIKGIPKVMLPLKTASVVMAFAASISVEV